MPPSKTAVALKAMKNLGFSENTVRPILNELLKLYDDNWKLIEEDSYRVLAEAILDSGEQKAHVNQLKRPNLHSGNETEENEPIVKKIKRDCPKNQPSPSSHAFISKSSKAAGFKRQETDIVYQRKKKNSCSPQPSRVAVEQETEYKMISDDENDESYFWETAEPLPDDMPLYGVPPLAVIHPDSPIQGSSYEKCSNEDCSIYPEVIDLDTEDEEEYICPDDDELTKDACGFEANCSELVTYNNSELEIHKHDDQGSQKLVVATSSLGEAKLTLMFNASSPAPGSNFHVPSLEALLKRVEQQCLSSYKIPQAGFSLLGLMQDMCECFLAAGTTSAKESNLEISPPEADNNQLSLFGQSTVPNDLEIGPSEADYSQFSLFGQSTVPNDLEIGPSEADNNQLNLFGQSTIPNDLEIGPSEADNSQLSLFGQSTVPNDLGFKFLPQIPMHFGSICFDLGRLGLIALNLDLSGYAIVEKRHFYLYINDIAKGHEAREVSLINEVNEEKGPEFSYIPKNVTYRNASMSFPLARVTVQDCCSDCFGDCLGLALESPSCNCAGKNGGGFAYTPEGLLKEELLNSIVSTSSSLPRRVLLYCQDCPLERSNGGESIGKCKGHVNREFIKECWYKCGCNMNCGNRVVQRGITAKLQVFMTSDGKGWGLRTLEDVPKSAFICEYVGEVVTIRELFERNVQKMSNSQMHPVLLDAGWTSKGVLKDDKALCLDATIYGNIARFINHRCCDANLVYAPVEVETPDHHYYHVAFFTTRKVKALEELTWDYGVEFGDRDFVKAFHCHCGSKMCRDTGSVRS